MWNMINKILAITIIMIFISGCSSEIMKDTENDDEREDTAVIRTTHGDITIELFSEESPVTVKNFRMYTENGFYDETIFHRVVDGHVIQGGGFTASGSQKETEEPIKNEAENGIKNLRGTVAMARTDVPDSATSQFFVNLADNEKLDHSEDNAGYAVFGKVIDGMKTVDKIESVETGFEHGLADWPAEDIVIKEIVLS